MIESISDAAELAVLAACFALAVVRALRERNQMWTTLTCFYACMLLGDAYWLGYLLVFGETPRYSYVADLGWIAGYVFLIMLAVEADRKRGVSAPVPAAWVPVAACAACCVYYIATSGDVPLNLADNGLLAAVGYFAVRGIAATRPVGSDGGRLAHNRVFHWSLLAFVAVEQAVWVASTFLAPGPILGMNAYIVVSFALTAAYAAILACAWRSGS